MPNRTKVSVEREYGRSVVPKDVLRRLDLLDENEKPEEDVAIWWENVDTEEKTATVSFEEPSEG